RFAVRLACAFVLVYGGFAFRQSYADHQAMLARRPTANEQRGMLNLSETSPVLLNDRRMTYLPSAPCWFTADGGYVQGCNMELYQRVMMVNYKEVAQDDPNPSAVGALSLLGGALALFLIMSFVGARWFCGWLCPLSAIGGVLDWLRRFLRLPHFKPSGAMKRVYVVLGLGLAVLGLLLSAAFPYLDEKGEFAGVKIPQYPFCKICPSERVCPVAAGGPAAYPPLATTEWGFGFFRYASMGMLAVFLLSFAAGRRFWCRLCPMGMTSGLFNRGGMFRLRKDALKCNRCGMCAEVCPMDIDSVRAEMEHADVSSFDCVLCLRCVEICPRDGCLALEHGGVRLTESRFNASVT
ncbi:MAG: 4Fe-4S binding protein, partial [Pseudomonadota bacterium]